MEPRNRRIIDQDALERNMRAIRAEVPARARLLAVVKADGYGHGAVTAAHSALAGGADMLAVASVDEGCKLREAGIKAGILVLGAVTASDVEDGVRAGLTQTVCSPEMVRLCAEAAEAAGMTAEVHLKVDTGMGRIGVRTMEERDGVLEAIGKARGVRLTGAFTHFSDADGDDSGMAYTEEQFRTFLEMTEGLGVIRHCANSAAIHRRPDMALDMVRAGISLYGYPPVETGIHLEPCMRWTAKVSYVKDVPEGTYVSYGRTYITERRMRIATVTCGYADGYHRSASGKAEVLIRGKRAKVLGRICMDQMMVDVSDIEGVLPEDEVVLMGRDGEDSITAEDIAKWSGTISYEVLLSVGSRVERVRRTDMTPENSII